MKLAEKVLSAFKTLGESDDRSAKKEKRIKELTKMSKDQVRQIHKRYYRVSTDSDKVTTINDILDAEGLMKRRKTEAHWSTGDHKVDHEKVAQTQDRVIGNTDRLKKARARLATSRKEKKGDDVTKYQDAIKRLQHQIKIDQKRVQNLLKGKPEDDGIKDAND